MAAQGTRSGYAPVNGLEMYYEVHGREPGAGEGAEPGAGAPPPLAVPLAVPLVVLHGAYMSVKAMGALVPALARTRRVIGVELQAHGHTADADRPLTYEGLADDVAALLTHLGVARVDVFGYSMGGGTGLQLAIRHPALVRKLVVVSASSSTAGMHQAVLESIDQITPEVFEGSPWKDEYESVAPHPEAFPTLVEKLKAMDLTPFDWPAGDIKGIEAPVLLVVGDSDAIRLEHAVELFRLLGGGVMGDLAPMPASQLAVLPATSHLGMIERTDWLVPMVTAFLDATPAEQPGQANQPE